MTSATYATFHSPLHLTTADISAIDTENLVDVAINELNLRLGENSQLPNMTGSAGSKTISLTSKQLGAVQFVFRVMYASYYQNAANKSVTGAVNVSTQDLMSNPVVLNAIEMAAQKLNEQDWSRAFI